VFELDYCQDEVSLSDHNACEVLMPLCHPIVVLGTHLRVVP